MRIGVSHFRHQPMPGEIIDRIAERFGVTREEAANLPLKTVLRVTTPEPEPREIIDAEFEVLAG